MNQHLALEKERGRPYGVMVCFVPRSLKDRYVRAAKMRRGRTISAFIREAMELLMVVEAKLLKRVELLAYELAEAEYLRSRKSEAIGDISAFEEGPTRTKPEKRRSAVSASPTPRPGTANPILAFVEAKERTEM